MRLTHMNLHNLLVLANIMKHSVTRKYDTWYVVHVGTVDCIRNLLLYREIGCYTCLLMRLRHDNLLQYRESMFTITPETRTAVHFVRSKMC